MELVLQNKVEQIGGQVPAKINFGFEVSHQIGHSYRSKIKMVQE